MLRASVKDRERFVRQRWFSEILTELVQTVLKNELLSQDWYGVQNSIVLWTHVCGSMRKSELESGDMNTTFVLYN